MEILALLLLLCQALWILIVDCGLWQAVVVLHAVISVLLYLMQFQETKVETLFREIIYFDTG